jgi:hypothetical protein
MSEHTKEPWRAVNGVDIQSGATGALAYVSTAGARGRNLEEALANARRIVSAVNFCAGTDSDYLDGAGNLGRLLGQNVNAKLLAAAEAVLQLEATPGGSFDSITGQHYIARLADAVKRARGEAPPAKEE